MAVAIAAAGCGASGRPTPPPERHDLLSRTPAGEDRCVLAKSHDRPFVIDWDATDVASFEAKAARDVVFVRYEGCKLSIVYGCSDEAVPGRYGAYGTPTWTSGSVEQIDMRDETTLWRELPLGAASLEGALHRGDALHLRYFVSGVAVSSREVTYRADLADNPRCAGVTHYVWAYNLGAFELAADSSARAGGGARAEDSLKHSGVLARCTSEDLRACRAPIRLALRAIDEGERPVLTASSPAGSSSAPSPPPPSVVSVLPGENPAQLASKIRAEARRKLELGDGTGCLADLDRAARIEPRPEARVAEAELRARCEMRAGQCEAGRTRLRAAFAANDVDRKLTDEALDERVSREVVSLCADGVGTAAERIERAHRRIYAELSTINDRSTPPSKALGEMCIRQGEIVAAALPTLTGSTAYEREAIRDGAYAARAASHCATRTNRCDKAWAYFRLAEPRIGTVSSARSLDEWLVERFASEAPHCELPEGPPELRALHAAEVIEHMSASKENLELLVSKAQIIATQGGLARFDAPEPPGTRSLTSRRAAVSLSLAMLKVVRIASAYERCAEMNRAYEAYLPFFRKWVAVGTSKGLKPEPLPICPRPTKK